MLYEMATGERPFKGDTSVSTLAAIMRDTPKPVTEVNPAIPKELGRVIRRALSKDPERRQQTGKDLRNELDDLRKDLESGELAAGASQTAAVRAAAPAPRRIPWAAVAGGLVLVAALAAGVMWSRREPASVRPATSDVPVNVTVTSLTTEGGSEMFPSLSPDGKWVVYTRDELGTGQTDILLRAVGGQTTINLTRDSTANDSQAVFSPDGERIAFRSERDGGGVFVMGRTGESVRRLTTEGFNPSWSPDGASIVYASQSVVDSPGSRAAGSQLWVASTTTSDRRQFAIEDAMQPAWSPHGQRIAYWGLPNDSAQRDLWTIAAGGGEPVRVTNDPAIDWSPAWSPDRRYLYFSSNRSGGFNLWRVAIDEASGRVLGEAVAVPIPRPRIGHLSVSADGASIAMASFAGESGIEALAFDPARGTVGARRRVTNSSEMTATPSVSPDGKWIAFYSVQQNSQEDLWVVNRDGTGLRQLTNDAAHDRRPLWSPDGTRLMFYSDRGGRYQVWTVATDGGGLMQVTDHPRLLIQPVWSPDGTRAIASVSISDNKLLLFDPRMAAGQQRVEELPPFPGGFTATSWSADGTRVAGHGNSRPGRGIVIYTVASRTYEELTRSGASPAWLPDGRRLLYTGGAGSSGTTGRELLLLDTATKISTPVYSSPGEVLGGAGLSPDAREIYINIYRLQADIALARLPTSVP